MAFTVFSKNGVICPISEAHVSLSVIEYTYGFGVYETIRVRKKESLFLNDHIERLCASASLLGIAHEYSAARLNDALMGLISAIDDETYNVKILLIGAPKGSDAQLYMLASNPHFPEKNLYRDGVSVITRNFERPFPHAKSLNMLQSYLAYRDARAEGAYDALLINRNGYITEGTRTNMFGLRGNTLVSPPEEDILLGVTRKHVLEVAARNGYTYVEEVMALNDAVQCDALFLTSTSTKIMPIKMVNSVLLSPIPEALRVLIRAYDVFHDTGLYSSS